MGKTGEELDGVGFLKMENKLKKGHKHREKKRKSESNEDGNKDRYDKGNLVIDDGLQKKDNDKTKKKRKRDYFEKEQLQENEPSRKYGPDLVKSCNPKPEKKKTHEGKGTEVSMEDMSKKINKKKMKIDVENIDTEDKSMEKQKVKVKVKVKGNRVRNRTAESVEKHTKKSKAKTKSKKVSFSGDVEVFPTSDTEPSKQTASGDSLVQGKRFTPEEDEIVKQAILDYITANDLEDEGLNMILNCKSYPGMRNCWQRIGLCIPYPPHTAVYQRAHILFERGETRHWTPEEIELLKKYHEKLGNSWKKIGKELGKHNIHVRDTWRRIKMENLKVGKWSQEEYQNLYDLVNLDLQMKINDQEKKSQHGMLRDNIPWTAISDKLMTRNHARCCTKWYNQLTSSLVVEKKWCDADDYRMIGVLYEMDAPCVEDVDWDDVLEHRPGEICLKRWRQMVKHIGGYGSKPFGEQVDVLAKRYCLDLAETRKVWDNKPVVP